MQSFKKALKGLPSGITALMVIFAIVPLWSLSFLPLPTRIVDAVGIERALHLAITYWVLPVVLCFLIVRRSFLFLPLFMLEGLSIILHAIMSANGQPAGIMAVRYTLLGVALGAGIVFINKDVYFPFLSTKMRFWRRNARMPAQSLIKLVDPDTGARASVMMEDCSATGMAMAGDPEVLDQVLSGKRKGDEIHVATPNKGDLVAVAGRIAWIHDAAHVRRVGFQAQSIDQMAQLLRVVTNDPTQRVAAGKFAQVWTQSSVKRVMISIWLSATAGAYMTPACGAMQGVKPAETSGSYEARVLVPLRKHYDISNVDSSPEFENSIRLVYAPVRCLEVSQADAVARVVEITTVSTEAIHRSGKQLVTMTGQRIGGLQSCEVEGSYLLGFETLVAILRSAPVNQAQFELQQVAWWGVTGGQYDPQESSYVPAFQTFIAEGGGIGTDTGETREMRLKALQAIFHPCAPGGNAAFSKTAALTCSGSLAIPTDAATPTSAFRRAWHALLAKTKVSGESAALWLTKDGDAQRARRGYLSAIRVGTPKVSPARRGQAALALQGKPPTTFRRGNGQGSGRALLPPGGVIGVAPQAVPGKPTYAGQRHFTATTFAEAKQQIQTQQAGFTSSTKYPGWEYTTSTQNGVQTSLWRDQKTGEVAIASSQGNTVVWRTIDDQGRLVHLQTIQNGKVVPSSQGEESYYWNQKTGKYETRDGKWQVDHGSKMPTPEFAKKLEENLRQYTPDPAEDPMPRAEKKDEALPAPTEHEGLPAPSENPNEARPFQGLDPQDGPVGQIVDAYRSADPTRVAEVNRLYGESNVSRVLQAGRDAGGDNDRWSSISGELNQNLTAPPSATAGGEGLFEALPVAPAATPATQLDGTIFYENGRAARYFSGDGWTDLDGPGQLKFEQEFGREPLMQGSSGPYSWFNPEVGTYQSFGQAPTVDMLGTGIVPGGYVPQQQFGWDTGNTYTIDQNGGFTFDDAHGNTFSWSDSANAYTSGTTETTYTNEEVQMDNTIDL